MSIEIADREYLENELKLMRICRFCLVQKSLTNIYNFESQTANPTPLSVQVMACASIEVYPNDGMPSWICTDCRQLFEHSYRFKQMCKTADTLLRQFPTTRVWPVPLEKPKLIQNETKKINASSNVPTTIVSKIGSTTVTRNVLPVIQTAFTVNTSGSKKILNSTPVKSPEPPAPIRVVKIEKIGESNDREENLNIKDVKNLIENDGDEKKFSLSATISCQSQTKRPKILNKASVRILNREANQTVEPKFSVPQMTLNEDGNVEIVTEILDPMYITDKIPEIQEKVAPVKTNVYPCPHCDRTFPLLQLRDIHMVNHNRERRFQCPDCGRCFFSKYDLQKHEVRHTGNKPFKCVVCEKAFSRATLLRRHEKTHTDIPKILCIYCEKAFLSKEELDQHVARHKKNRPFQCRVCQKSFAFKQGLERHEIVHSAIQPYPCQYCDKSFPTPSKLARHLTAHAGKRPYPCKYCNKSYLLSHHLSRHVRSHKHVKSLHACTECYKVFKTRDELIYHSAVHTTATLVCALCQTRFDALDEVSSHIKEHIEGDTFACEFCDLLFLKAEDQLEHCKIMHAKDFEAYDELPQPDQNIEAMCTDNELQNNASEEYYVDDVDEEFLEHLADEDDEDWNDDDDNTGDGDSAKSVDATKSTEKPKILNQIVIKSNKESTVLVQLSSEEPSTSESTDAAVKQESDTKIRKIITLGGRVQSIEAPTDEAIPAKRRKIVLPFEQKIDIKTEKVEAGSLNTENNLETKSKTVQLKSQPVSSEAIATKVSPAISPKQSTVPRKITRQSVLPLSANRNASQATIETKAKPFAVTKAQAAALAKEGRLKFKDGKMLINKEFATRESAAKKGNK